MDVGFFQLYGLEEQILSMLLLNYELNIGPLRSQEQTYHDVSLGGGCEETVSLRITLS